MRRGLRGGVVGLARVRLGVALAPQRVGGGRAQRLGALRGGALVAAFDKDDSLRHAHFRHGWQLPPNSAPSAFKNPSTEVNSEAENPTDTQ